VSDPQRNAAGQSFTGRLPCRSWLISVAVLITLACGAAAPQSPPERGTPVGIQVAPVPLNPTDPRQRLIGGFEYAGGIEIKATNRATILELSDLRVSGDSLVAISDQGLFFEARVQFDEMNRLTGLTDARMIPLIGESGKPLGPKDTDAEGLDVLPDGSRLVSFEGNDRILLYPPDGGPPRPAPRPEARFPQNTGMEAIALYPAAGADAYLVGSEGGTVWLCRLSGSCSETTLGTFVPTGMNLTALAAYGEDGAFAMLSRAYEPRTGVRISVRLIANSAAGARLLDEMTMAPPLNVDNFEGIAAVRRPDGGIRLYLVADDNGSDTQRTYLFAFDRPSAENAANR
jgi:hypothetical protein